MQDVNKTKEELATEVTHLRQRIAELEAAETERKRAEEILKEREVDFRALVENAAEGIVIVSRKGNFLYANSQAAAITGYSVEELLHVNMRDLFSPDEYKKINTRFKKRIVGETVSSQYETEIIRKDGNRIPLDTSIALTTWDGELIRIVSLHEITDRKRIEEQLREAERQYRLTLDSMGDTIHVIDSDFRVLLFNVALRQWVEQLGLETDVIGRTVFEAFPFLSDTVGDECRQVFDTGAMLITEDRTKIHGKEFITETRKIPIYEGGKVARIATIIRDITERKQAEDELRESEATARALLNAAADVAALVDTKGIVLDVNEAMAQRFGRSVDELIGVNGWDLIPTGIAERRKPYFDKAVQSGKPSRFEDESGGVWFDTVFYPVRDGQGKITKMALLARDITERKQAEEELLEAAEQYRILTNTAMDGFAKHDLDGRILDVNKAYCHMLGYSKEELLKMTVADIEAKETADGIKRQVNKIMEVGSDRFETRHRRKDGCIIDVEISMTLLRQSGQILVFLRDITERKLAEEALRESEERFRTIFETAQDFIFLKDRDSKFTAVNPAMEQLYGVPASELIGKTGAALFGKAMAARLREKDVRVLSGEIIDEEHPSPVKGSTDIHHIIKVPIRNSAGEIIGLCGIGRDNTKRKQMEEALRESEERFRTIVEQAAEAIIAHDLDGQVLLVNSLACEYTGYSQEELLSMNVLGLDPEILEKEHKRRYWEKLQVGKYVKVEATHIRKDGSTYAAEVYLVKIIFEGQPIILCLARDITERKQMEETLRNSEEKYRLLVDNIDLGINLIDPDLTIIMANASVGKRWKKPVSELIGKKCFREFEHRDTVCPDCPGVQTMATGQPIEIVHEEVQDGQGCFHVRLQTFPHIAQDGTVIGFTEIAEDITDRKQTEKALEESENRFRLLVEHSVDAFILHDIDGRILDVNQHTCESLGYTQEELLGLYIHDIDQNVAAGRHMEQWEQMVPGEPVTLEGVHRRKDGTTFPVEVRLAVFELDGGKLMLGLVRDVTERKQSEKALREREAFNYALFHYNPVETIVVDLEGRVTAFNLAKENSGNRLPTIGDRMYKDYAGKHEIDMRAELMTCIGTSESKELPERKYGDKYLNITISPFAHGAIIISEDITERKRAEEGLRESEQFSSGLLRNAPNPIIVINPDTSIRYVNPALEKLTGFSTAELIGRKAPYPWWTKETLSKTRMDLEMGLRKGAQEMEEHFQKKTGGRFCVEITARPIMYDGELQYFLANWIDITERKLAEELLQKERDTFYSILDRAPYGVMVQDTAGNHSFVNNAFTNITGYTLKDIPTTREWWHRAYPSQQYRNLVMETWENDYIQSKAEETFRERFGRVFSRTFTVVCKDGAAKEIEFRTSVIGDEGNIFMLSDTTDRKRMHALLETAAAEWRTTFDAISDAVCLVDPHGKIIRCNNAMLRIMGKPFSQITNHHCWEVMHGVSKVPQSCPIVSVGKSHHRETEVMSRDSRWFNVSVDPLLDEDGNFIGGVHIMSDITESKRVEDELQNSREQLRNLTVYLESVRELERTNIAREIHDELAQALTALKMDLSWLDHRLPSDQQSISEKTKSMSNLIDSTIQTVKRISAELRPGILDDLGLVAAIEWQTEEFQSRTGIICHLIVDPQDLTVDQDRSTAIFRIFQETLTNVARHARATRVAVGLKERAGKVTLRVRDNGIGITEEQISDSQSFGLIGMQERIIPWGGKISFKGIPGKGTTVIVSVGLGHSNKDIEKIE